MGCKAVPVTPEPVKKNIMDHMELNLSRQLELFGGAKGLRCGVQ